MTGNIYSIAQAFSLMFAFYGRDGLRLRPAGPILLLFRKENFQAECFHTSSALKQARSGCLSLNSEIELKIMRHFLLADQISEKLAQANVRGW